MNCPARVSAQVHRVAEMLAAEIEAGEFNGLSAERRNDFRMLPPTLSGLADIVETLEAERDQLRDQVKAQAAARRAAIRFGVMTTECVAAVCAVFAVLWQVM